MTKRIILSFITLFALFCVTMVCYGQSTKRRGLKAETTHSHVSAEAFDTIRCTEKIDSLVAIKEFSKTLQSRREGIILENLSSSDTIVSVTIDIDYHSVKGSQLHRREATFRVTIPPHERRYSSVASWDNQQRFYYVKTPPTRISDPSRAFDVKFRIINVVLKAKN